MEQQTQTAEAPADAEAPATTEASTQSEASSTPSWSDSLDGDLKNYLGNKGWKEPKDILESYRNLEKLHGVPQERLLKLPETLEGEEAREVWQRLGTPKDVDGYQFELSPAIGDADLAGKIKEMAFKNNIPRSQFEGFIKQVNGLFDEKLKMDTEELRNEMTKQENSLKQEWAGEFEKNSNIADQTARTLGFDKAEIEAIGKVLGPAKAMKMLLRLGTATGESKFVDAGGGRADVKTPDSARAEINELIRDQDFQHKLRLRDSDALRRWNRLHEMAAPGQMTI